MKILLFYVVMICSLKNRIFDCPHTRPYLTLYEDIAILEQGQSDCLNVWTRLFVHNAHKKKCVVPGARMGKAGGSGRLFFKESKG